MRKRPDEPGINMTPMIDVVFQLIIFFITTADMQNKDIDQSIKLAMAPHGTVVKKKDPRTININVARDGTLKIAGGRLSQGQLISILRKAVTEYGSTTPVVIRGDSGTTHEKIRAAMDACTAAGIWQIKFGAIKELNTKKKQP